MEATNTSFSRLMDKHTVVHLGKRHLSSVKRNELSSHGKNAGFLHGKGGRRGFWDSPGLLCSHEGKLWPLLAPGYAGKMLPVTVY